MMKRSVAQLFPWSWRDIAVAAGLLLAAVCVCIPLRIADSSEGFAYPIFVLTVLLISRFTTGYLYGVLASVLGVICVNFIFTYPYLAFNLTITGYPLTFFTFLAVSLITSTLTTRLKLEERLRAENEKEQQRANLLRAVSHDIRTPLTSIVGSTSAVLENPGLTGEEQRTLLEGAREEAQWLIRVVENLLSITRIGEDQAHIAKETEAAEEVVEEAVRKFRRRFPEVTVSVSVPEELLMVPMDPILIEQVLANLLENAVLHGETTDHVGLCLEREGDWARFTLRDNGRGIPEKALPAIFDAALRPAEAADGSGKRNMGLGLSVCRAIVGAHGGDIEARNWAEGAEFSFRLPIETGGTTEEEAV